MDMMDAVLGSLLAAVHLATGRLVPVGVLALGTLALLGFLYRYIPLVTSAGTGLGDALAGVILIMVTTGGTMWVVQETLPMTEALQTAAVSLGATASGGSVTAEQLRQPSTVLAVHKQVTAPLETFITNHKGWSALKNLPTIALFWLAEVTIYLVFVGIAVSMAMIQLEFSIACMLAPVLVPMVVWTNSSFLGEFSVGWVLGTAVRLLLIAAIIGLAVPLFSALTPATAGAVVDPSWADTLGVVGSALLFGLTAWEVPKRAGNLVGSGLGLSGATVAASAAGVARVGMMVGGVSQAIRGVSPLLARR
jgi:type IV secretory pathway TrbL component